MTCGKLIATMALLIILSSAGSAANTVEVPADYKDKTNPYWNDINAIKEGESLYAQHCAACHSSDGRGTLPNQPDFRDVDWWVKQRDDYLLWRVSEGVENTSMPAWKTRLGEDDIWKILGYARTFPNQQLPPPAQTTGFAGAVGIALLLIAATTISRWNARK
jgi:mono/diheme cytochrome c family protein